MSEKPLSGEIMTTLEEALSHFHGEDVKTKPVESSFEMQAINLLRAIFDKVNSMDRYIRSRQSSFSGRTYVSPEQQKKSDEMANKLNAKRNAELQGEVKKLTD